MVKDIIILDDNDNEIKPDKENLVILNVENRMYYLEQEKTKEIINSLQGQLLLIAEMEKKKDGK